MSISWFRGVLVSVLACTLIATAFSVRADFPDRPVRFVIGFTPGGGVDAHARITAAKLSEYWKQSVVVESRPGADGMIAASYVSRSTNDGYTLLFTADAQDILEKLVQQPTGWLDPIGGVAEAFNFFIVPSSLGINTLPELLEYARENPGKLSAGNSGRGTAPFYAIDMLKKMAGVDIVQVSYKGSGAGMTALLGGEIQLLAVTPASFEQHAEVGTVNVLAVTSSVRSPFMPDVPTVAEAANLPEYVSPGTWYSLLAPAGTPDEIIKKINADLNKVMNSRETADELNQYGTVSIAGTPKEMFDKLAKEYADRTNLNY